MSSRAGHVTTETVYGQALGLQLGDGDEHCTLELYTTGLNVYGNLYLCLLASSWGRSRGRKLDILMHFNAAVVTPILLSKIDLTGRSCWGSFHVKTGLSHPWPER